MQIIKYILKLLAFLLELIMFGALGYYGYKAGKSPFTTFSLLILLPLLAITLRAISAAPKSDYRLQPNIRIAFGLYVKKLNTKVPIEAKK